MAKLTWLVGILTAVLVGCGGESGELGVFEVARHAAHHTART